MRKKIGLFLCFSILLTGCQGFETTPSSITLPAKETEVHTVMQEMWKGWQKKNMFLLYYQMTFVKDIWIWIT